MTAEFEQSLHPALWPPVTDADLLPPPITDETVDTSQEVVAEVATPIVGIVAETDAEDLATAVENDVIHKPTLIQKVGQNFRRIGNTIATFGREAWWGTDQPVEKGWKVGWEMARAKRVGAAVLSLGTQGIDRSRAMIVALPFAFDHALTYSQEHNLGSSEQAALAAVAVGGLFAGWSYIVGKTLHYSINQFPKTTERFSENHPATVQTLRDSIDGFPTQRQLKKSNPEKPETGYETKPYDSRKGILGKAALALSRGLKTGFLYGTTMQVGLAKAEGHSDKSVERRLRTTAIEGAGALAVTAAAVSLMVSHNSLGMAQDVRDFITNKNLLIGLSFGFIGYNAIAGYFARRSQIKRMEKAQALYQDLASDEVASDDVE